MISLPRWFHKYELKPDLWIYVPTEETIKIGTKIKNAVNDNWSIPFYYFHLQQGGHVAALKYHKNDTYFVHLDIEKFFNTINRSRLTRSLKLHFDYRTARDYTLTSAVKHPSKTPATYILPYGFVQSPILASLCLRNSTLGNKIDEVSRSISQRISIYMDDIIISGNDKSSLTETKNSIKAAAVRSGFKFNQSKEQGPATRITVFNVNLASTHLAIEKQRYNELKANYLEAENPNVSHGIATYVSTVNKKQLAALDA